MFAAATLLRPESTALLVIDLQEKLTPVIEDIEPLLANTKNLLRLAKRLGLTTLLTTQYRKGLGRTLPQIQELAAVEPLDKICFGCMGDGAFRSALDQALPEGGTILVAGIETHICVLQTVLGALDAGYRVHVASDATGARATSNAELGLQRMCQAGAVISSTEMAIYELLGDSHRPEFKQMLPYLKK